MIRLIEATILITVVYSWEDLKRTLVWSMRSILRQKNKTYTSNNYDQIVGTALVLATLPANLVYLLLGEGALMIKLLVVLSELLLIGLLVEVVEVFIHLANAQPHQTGIWVMISSVLIGAAQPTVRLAGQIISHKELFTSYLRHLIFPILFGIGLKFWVDHYGSDVVAAHSDTLVGIAVAGVVINVTIELLERFFRRHRIPLSAYFRIVLGLLLIVTLGGFGL